MSGIEITNGLEVPLLGAHPNPPDAGNVLYYTLLSDFREYVQFDSGEFQYRNPRKWLWHGYYNGTRNNSQWIRNTDGTPQSRRTNFLCPYNEGRLAQFTFSSRNDLTTGAVIRLRIHEDLIDAAGDVTNSDPVTVDILSNDPDAVVYREGKRWFIDLRSKNIIVDNTKRYAIQVDNIGNGTSYRDPRIDIEIEERAVNP